jgi:hypothetical protein
MLVNSCDLNETKIEVGSNLRIGSKVRLKLSKVKAERNFFKVSVEFSSNIYIIEVSVSIRLEPNISILDAKLKLSLGFIML